MKNRIFAIAVLFGLMITMISFSFAAEFSSSRVLKKSATVGNEYLENTLFVGDSRIQGLQIACASSTPATFFGAQSCTASQIDTREGVTVEGSSKKYTIIGAIEQSGRQFERIYMMFGINELGSGGGTPAIIRGFRSAVEKLRAVQPAAEICIMGVMPVFNSCSYVSGYTGAVANPKILALNEALVSLAEEMSVYYLDTYHLFATSDGQLLSTASKDGIHLNNTANKEMMEYVKTHAIPKKSVTPYSAGDLTGDGYVDEKDSVRLAQYMANWDISVKKSAADCNGDGNINAKDAVLLAQYLANWKVSLG